MERGTTSTFADAGVRHRELTPRQIDVLRLVAEGRTNGQIGAALDITLDGAKWNVSELLTKLGLDSREELAGYWRWYNRRSARLGRALRGLLPFSALKIAAGAGGVAALGAIGVFAFALFAGGTDGPTPPNVPPFQLEARITIVDIARTIGTSIAGATPSSPLHPDGPDQSTSVIRWSYLDRTHSREDIENVGPALDATNMTIAFADGKMTAYYSSSNTYSVIPYELPHNGVIPPAISVLIGPMPYADIPAMQAAFRDSGSSGRSAEIVGHEVVLGRETTIIEVSPTEESSNNGVTKRSGSMRVWVDPERMFAMRSVSAGDVVQTYTMDVTSLKYDLPPDQVDASFTPPPGAKEVDPNANLGSVSSGSGSSTATSPGAVQRGSTVMAGYAGFLAASYLPAGYTITSTGTESGTGAKAGQTVATDTRLSNAAGDTLRIEQRQRADGLPPALVTTDTTTVNGQTAYRGTSGAAKTLAWEQHGLSILITASALDYPELERIAASMTLQ
jgi:DNA-binding CsgD family transcriptional regulator